LAQAGWVLEASNHHQPHMQGLGPRHPTVTCYSVMPLASRYTKFRIHNDSLFESR
jgi:hypothetical protein